MSRILVTVMPFSGHVAPVTGVVAEFISRGHSVTVYTGSRYLQRFTALGAVGFPWVQAPDFDEHDLPATFPAVGRRGPIGLLANLEHIFIRSGTGQVADILAAHAETPFDVIVSDVMAIGGGLAAERLGIPWATLSIVPLSLPSVDLPPSGAALHPGFGGFGALRDGILRGLVGALSASLDRAHRAVRGSLGLPRGRSFAQAIYSPWLVAATGSPSIEYPRSDLGAQFHFVGRLVPAGGSPFPRPAWWSDLAGARTPVALVTQGTFNVDPGDLLAPAMDGLAESDVLVLGTTAGIDLPFPIPANARVAPYLPFAEVLPLVDVVISNGGWGGVLETLGAGVPLIVAGGDLDKPEIAARVGWSRAGIDLRTGRPRASAVAKAYTRIIGDPSYQERARAIAAELGALGGNSAVVDLVERLLATGDPVRRETGPWG